MAQPYHPPAGHGPAPNMPPSVMEAAKLPPLITETHVFFFGYEGPEPENCFQQWYPSVIREAKGYSHGDGKDDGNTGTNGTYGASDADAEEEVNVFPTAEHYMMYHKALLMHDHPTASLILSSPSPATAKTLGRQVQNFDQTLWDSKCDAIVTRGNWLKFSQDEALGKVLRATGTRALVEASPSDRVWGVGFAAAEAEGMVRDGREGEWGANKLGRALMEVRGMWEERGK